MLLAEAMVAVDLGGAKELDSIQGNEGTASQQDVLLQDFAALQLAKDILKAGRSRTGSTSSKMARIWASLGMAAKPKIERRL